MLRSTVFPVSCIFPTRFLYPLQDGQRGRGCGLWAGQGLPSILPIIHTVKIDEDISVENAWDKSRAGEQQAQVGWARVERLPGGGKPAISLRCRRTEK